MPIICGVENRIVMDLSSDIVEVSESLDEDELEFPALNTKNPLDLDASVDADVTLELDDDDVLVILIVTSRAIINAVG